MPAIRYDTAAIFRYPTPITISASSFVKILMRAAGQRKHKSENARLTSTQILRLMHKSLLRVFLSRLPAYWAPSIWKAETTPVTIMFWTNWIWDASETADIAFCSRLPSMTVSEAATVASSIACSAIGKARRNSLDRKDLSLKVSRIRLITANIPRIKEKR